MPTFFFFYFLLLSYLVDTVLYLFFFSFNKPTCNYSNLYCCVVNNSLADSQTWLTGGVTKAQHLKLCKIRGCWEEKQLFLGKSSGVEFRVFPNWKYGLLDNMGRLQMRHCTFWWSMLRKDVLKLKRNRCRKRADRMNRAMVRKAKLLGLLRLNKMRAKRRHVVVAQKQVNTDCLWMNLGLKLKTKVPSEKWSSRAESY